MDFVLQRGSQPGTLIRRWFLKSARLFTGSFARINKSSGDFVSTFWTRKPKPQDEIKDKGNRVRWIGVALLVGVAAITPVLLATLDRPRASYAGGGGGNGNDLEICCVPETLHSLKGNSTLIITGNVVSLAGTYYRGLGLIYDYQVSITQYLKGSGPTLLYVETGGVSSPQLEVGHSYVLFLWESESDLMASCRAFNLTCVPPPTSESLTYPPTASAEGLFLIDNGLVYGMKTLYPQYDWIKITVNSEAETSFISEVIAA